jgi:hypothetical protein
MNVELRYPEWQQRIVDALMERDPSELPERIQIARHTIAARLAKLSSDDRDDQERQALNDALNTLRVLETDKRRS